MFSAGERKFIEEGIECGVRSDGRGLNEARFEAIECGLLPQANGSCRVRILGGSTDVLSGVKAELVEPDRDHPSRGQISIHVSYWASSTSNYASRETSERAASLASAIQRVMDGCCLNWEGLCVVRGSLVWRLHVDVLILGGGGGLSGAVWTSVLGALRSGVLPELKVSRAVEGSTRSGGFDIEVVDGSMQRIDDVLEGVKLPVIISFASIQSISVLDPSLEEESCASVLIDVAIDREGNVVSLVTKSPISSSSTTTTDTDTTDIEITETSETIETPKTPSHTKIQHISIKSILKCSTVAATTAAPLLSRLDASIHL